MKKLNYKIFVINMARSVERWNQISAQLDKFGLQYEWVGGVDASGLPKETVNFYFSEEKNRRDFPRPLSLGEIGCHISHIKCWQKITEYGLDFAVILEDDVVLSDKFPAALQFLQDKYFKWNFIRLQIEEKNRILYKERIYSDFSLREYIRTSGCAWGYALNFKTAKKLLKNIIPFGCPADSNTHLYYKYGIDILTLFPPVVFCKNENGSEIDSYKNRLKIRNFHPFARQVFQFKSYAGKLNYLRKRDGLHRFLKRMAKLRTIKPPLCKKIYE